MSNFTTFFPSAGGGGGEGSGINSYAPFKVGTTDNNPQGYIHSTGLYTNPIDSSVWLKTGNQVLDTASAYPNAMGVDGAAYSGTSFSTDGEGSQIQSITYDGTNFAVLQGSSKIVFQYTTAGTYTGFSFSVSAQDTSATGITFDGTNYWMVGANSDKVFKYTSAGVYTGTSFSISSQETVPYGITSDANNVYITGQNSLGRIAQFTKAGVYTGFRFATGFIPGDITFDGTHFYATNNTYKTVHKFTSAGVNLGFVTLPNQRSILQAVVYDSANSKYFTAEDGTGGTAGIFGYDAGNTVGDATARTDSSGSAQPLFIKLK